MSEHTRPIRYRFASATMFCQIPAPMFLLWAPDYVPGQWIRHRGRVAVVLQASTSDRAPELWINGTPHVFLRPRSPLRS